MKKILVLSDSHSYFDEALKIFEKEKPDIINSNKGSIPNYISQHEAPI